VKYGMAVNASRQVAITRTGLTSIGIKALAARHINTSRTSLVAIGMKALASRGLVMSRTARVAYGMKALASRQVAITRTALVAYGLKAFAKAYFPWRRFSVKYSLKSPLAVSGGDEPLLALALRLGSLYSVSGGTDMNTYRALASPAFRIEIRDPDASNALVDPSGSVQVIIANQLGEVVQALASLTKVSVGIYSGSPYTIPDGAENGEFKYEIRVTDSEGVTVFPGTFKVERQIK